MIPAAVPTSPGPQRSPTEISLAQLAHVPSNEDVGEGTSRNHASAGFEDPPQFGQGLGIVTQHRPEELGGPPPGYTSPEGSIGQGRRRRDSGDNEEGDDEHGEEEPLIRSSEQEHEDAEQRDETPIPTYDAAVAEGGGSRRSPARRGGGGG